MYEIIFSVILGLFHYLDCIGMCDYCIVDGIGFGRRSFVV
jgi:hypothetical protein